MENNNKIIKMDTDIPVKFEGNGASVSIGKNIQYASGFKIALGNNAQLVIGNNVNLRNSSIVLSDEAIVHIGNNCKMKRASFFINSGSKLKIGDHCTFGAEAKIRSGKSREIIIGEDCMFSWNVTLLGHDGHAIYNVLTGECMNDTDGGVQDSIFIGAHVWIGGETVILPNSQIGAGSICGYRSLIKGKYPNNCMIGGSIAKVIKKDICWSRNKSDNQGKTFVDISEKYKRKSVES